MKIGVSISQCYLGGGNYKKQIEFLRLLSTKGMQVRKILDEMEDAQAIQFLIDRIKTHKTNDEFFSSMKNGNGKKSKSK